MASLSREGAHNSKPSWRITWMADGRQKAIRLGAIPKRAADRLLLLVERLLESQRLGLPLDGETIRWIQSLDDKTARKLARAGLISPRVVLTVETYLKQWLDDRRKLGAATESLIAWGQTVKELSAMFGPRPLASLTIADGEAYRDRMLARKLRPSTISKRLGHARLMLADAVRRGLLPSNPWQYVRHHQGNVAERRAYVPIETFQKAIESAPNVWWRLLLALARLGGLRIPSEAFRLTWSDVNWERQTLTVPSPKTARYGKAYRVIPIFKALLPYLQEAWEAAEEGQTYVFPEDMRRRALGRRGFNGCNLRQGLLRILRRAGIEPWPRLWHSLRASHESDLAARFPLATVAKWLGNTPSIALRHYVDPTDQLFEAAKAWEHPTAQGSGDVIKSVIVNCRKNQQGGEAAASGD